jgi:hypothetical protein
VSNSAGQSCGRDSRHAHEPEVFFTTPACDGWPLVMLRRAQVDVEHLAELVTGARRTRARPARASELGKTGDRPDMQPG